MRKFIDRALLFTTFLTLLSALVVTAFPGTVWASYDYDGAQTDHPVTYASAELTVLPVSGVRLGTEDFVASRILAKSKQAGPGMTWLEVGYVYHGYQGYTEIYTWDTEKGWTFYPWFPLEMGQHIVVSLAAVDGIGWTAYLQYGEKSYTLRTTWGAGPRAAYMEHYVERHRDEGRTDPAVTAPLVAPVSGDVIKMDPPAGTETPINKVQKTFVELHFWSLKNS